MCKYIMIITITYSTLTLHNHRTTLCCTSDHRWVHAPPIVPPPLPLLNKSRLTRPPTPMMGTR